MPARLRREGAEGRRRQPRPSRSAAPAGARRRAAAGRVGRGCRGSRRIRAAIGVAPARTAAVPGRAGAGRGRGLGGRPRPHRAAAPFDDGPRRAKAVAGARAQGGCAAWSTRAILVPAVPGRGTLARPPRGRAHPTTRSAFRRRTPAPSATHAPGPTPRRRVWPRPRHERAPAVGNHICSRRQRRPTARL